MTEATPDWSAALGDRLAAFGDRLREAVRRSGRAADAVTLVAVSKFQPVEAMLALQRLGVCHFGENYVQEALRKQERFAVEQPGPAPERGRDVQWHFIGHLQSNKAKDVAGRFELIHTLDSLKAAEALQRRLPESCPVQPVLIQVNIGREPQKGGVLPEELMPFAEAVVALPRLSVRGLMCLPPMFDNPEAARPHFAALRKLKELLECRFGGPLQHLSMGMSGDFEAAIEEGATLVRVGTSLFGERQRPA